MVKPLHAGRKHQIWYMYSLDQYKHFLEGVPDFEGQGQGQFKVKCWNGVLMLLLQVAVYSLCDLCIVLIKSILDQWNRQGGGVAWVYAVLGKLLFKSNSITNY